MVISVARSARISPENKDDKCFKVIFGIIDSSRKISKTNEKTARREQDFGKIFRRILLIYSTDMETRRRKKDFDVIIVGGGAAGLSAALWCDDLRLKALLLEASAELGGQLLWTYNRIENHLGARAENGREMRDVFVRQIERRELQLKFSSKISTIDFEEKSILLETGETVSARFLIAATGIRRRRLNVPGENEFAGRGIVESGKREQSAVKDKRAAIVGGGDAAFENALILAETASKVFLINRGESFRARREFVDPVLSNPKIEVFRQTIVLEIGGGERLETVRLKNLKTGETFDLPADALLIRAGVEPNSGLFRGHLDLDENGYVKINAACQTSVEGVFAVGDIANPLAPTVSGAVGMGATAVKQLSIISRQLKKKLMTDN